MDARPVNLTLDWAAVGLLFLADGILLLTTEFRLLWQPEIFILLSAGALCVIGLVYSSFRDAPRLANMALIGGLLVLFTNATAVLNYILYGIFPLPLWDHQYDAVDKMLGLNWLQFYLWSMAWPELMTASNIVYFALGPEVIFLVLWLEFSGRHGTAVSFWRHFAASAFMTISIGILMPAAGPFVLYHLPIAQSTGYVWQEAALRNGSLRLIDLGHVEGLVCFPSFHTALALLCAYAARGLKYLALPLLLLNGAIIFSSPVIGGHYFVDILAGAILAAVIIAVEERFKFTRGVLFRAPVRNNALGQQD